MPTTKLMTIPEAGEVIGLPDGRRAAVLMDKSTFDLTGEVRPALKPESGMPQSVRCRVIGPDGLAYRGSDFDVSLLTPIKYLSAPPVRRQARPGRPTNGTGWRGWAAKNSALLDPFLKIPKGLRVIESANYYRVVEMQELKTICVFYRRGLLGFRNIPTKFSKYPVHPKPPAAYLVPDNIVLHAVHAMFMWDDLVADWKAFLKGMA